MSVIPAAALDDRLGFVGNTGSGKTYSAGTAIERLMTSGARAVIPDALGVWWGLALDRDGKAPSTFRKREQLVIFGGQRGDLPLTEHAGALIGETVAGMQESCILDLSDIGTKAAERRFMLTFLSALYKHKSGEPLHIIFDEADLWAPQRILDKEGDAMKLLGMMETICRRGRVKGFIPWLITQRPAVLSKNVLSQVDGLVAFKLTSVQDRDAIGDWVEGQADKARWRELWADMARLNRGEALVWLPARGILKSSQFPEKETFDSSRAPTRGEKPKAASELQPVNLGRLKERLSRVEAETKANDPKALRGEIARLQRELSSKLTPAVSEAELFDRGYRKGILAGRADLVKVLEDIRWHLDKHCNEAQALADQAWRERPPPAPKIEQIVVPTKRARATKSASELGKLQLIIDGIRWWNVLGIVRPTQAQVAFAAGYSPNSGTWGTYLSRLRSMGLIEGRGDLVLTEDGLKAANEPPAPPNGERLREVVLNKISPPLARILRPIIEHYPNGLSHPEAAALSGYSPHSGTWGVYLSRLRTLDLIDGRGELKAQDWLFPVTQHGPS